MYDHSLPDRLRNKGLVVELVGGWEWRGGDLQPVGSINHHTAGSPNGIAPSLNTCIYGRSDVPGPLCNVLQGRHPTNPMLDPVYVIAAGKANHGGNGEWRGVSGNSRYYGLEIEHTGTGAVLPERLEVAARIHAAFLEGTPNRDPNMVPQHFEYALPRGRKIDFFNLAPTHNANTFRARVSWWVGRSAVTPPKPKPPIILEDGMDYVIQAPNRPAAVLFGGRAFVKLSAATSTIAFRNAKDMQFIQLDNPTDFDAIDRQVNIDTLEPR